MAAHGTFYQYLDYEISQLRRANEGRKIAKEKGVKFGRKPKLTSHQQKLVRERLSNGDTCRSIAKDLGVSHSTISRIK